MEREWEPIETMPKDGSKFDVWIYFKNYFGDVKQYRIADCVYALPYHGYKKVRKNAFVHGNK